MNIPYFDKWVNVIKEGFNAEIKSDDDDVKDEIEIEAPNENNTIKYVVNGDNVKSKKIISTDTGYQENENDVNDKNLEDDIIDAVDKINDIKDRIKAKELRRLTGGDRSTDLKTVKQIKDIFNGENFGTSEYLYNKDTESFFKGEKGIFYYLDISKIEGKYNINKTEVYNNFKPKKCVGKGEYLLPLLFDDVYKQKVYGEDTKGDNFIVHDNDKYYLELKSPNAHLNLHKYARDYIKTQFNNITDNLTDAEKNNIKKDIYKNAITSSFLNYAKKQIQKNDPKNLYMCIFGKTVEKSPKDVLFINLTKVNDNDIIIDNNTPLFQEILNLIDIDNIYEYTIGRNGKRKKDISHSFTFTYNYNGEEKEQKINCKLKSEIVDESLILSRDNFINEIYTK